MRKELAPLLARTAIDEVETQHDAVGRLVKVFAEARDGSAAQDVVDDSRTALYGLLASPRLAVVSKACHGEPELLQLTVVMLLLCSLLCNCIVLFFDMFRSRKPRLPILLL